MTDDLISRQKAIDDEQKLINKEQAIDKIKKRLFETALNNVGIKQNIDETLVDVAENRLENWFNELPSVQPERKKPVFKTGESVYHVSYADGTGGFEKNKWADWTCPDCGWFVGEQYIPRRRNQQKCNYCAKCGCAIDWSDADMRGETE